MTGRLIAGEVEGIIMTTIEAKIPEPVLKQARELAERENIPLEQVISLAVTQVVGLWSNESYIPIRGARATKEKFIDALRQVPDSEPLDHDRLPEGYVPRPL
jgi:antitoxin component of RelBE/YafQ-DinJ toxin-antitoxin module